jgi:hypothetical protein
VEGEQTKAELPPPSPAAAQIMRILGALLAGFMAEGDPATVREAVLRLAVIFGDDAQFAGIASEVRRGIERGLAGHSSRLVKGA